MVLLQEVLLLLQGKMTWTPLYQSTELLVTCSILSIFLSKSKNQHICYHGNHGSNVGVEVVSVADS